uniref:Uncharacterized protein n=1 Tax=Cannabis sativa TaxID=3483 RepID=A0A803PCA6_CANSA
MLEEFLTLVESVIKLSTVTTVVLKTFIKEFEPFSDGQFPELDIHPSVKRFGDVKKNSNSHEWSDYIIERSNMSLNKITHCINYKLGKLERSIAKKDVMYLHPKGNIEKLVG